MATTWLPKFRQTAPRSYLLTNGDIIQEPNLEETSTGLKVRVAGDNVSFYRREEWKAIEHGLTSEAHRRKASVWMPVDLNESVLKRRWDFAPAKFDPNASTRAKATAWWSFKHPTLPIKAVLTIVWHTAGNYDAANNISMQLYVPRQQGLSPHADGLNPVVDVVVQAHDSTGWWENFINVGGLTERQAVETLLRQVRKLEELDEIEIPDSRDGHDHLTLKLDVTSVNGKFLADITDYLESEVGVEKVLAAYQQLLVEFRKVGVVLDNGLTNNQLAQALSSGDDKMLTVTIRSSLQDEDGRVDKGHELAVHLPTGTFAISCSSVHQDAVSLAWEESLILARLSGKEDTLLAYAEEYVRTKHIQKSKKIVAMRKTALGAH